MWVTMRQHLPTLTLKGNVSMTIYQSLMNVPGSDHRHVKRYEKFIKSRSTKTGVVYVERHHILPRSIFPEFEFEESNIIKLTAKEHYIAHLLLYKALPKSYPMLRAFWGMCNGWCRSEGQNRFKPSYNSKTYSVLKAKVSVELSLRVSQTNPYTSEKVKETIINKHGGLGNGSESIFAKQKQTMIESYGVDNIFKHPDFIAANIERTKESWKDENARAKRIANMKVGLRNRPVLECPYCGKQSKSNSNMQRYHFDNCKHRK